MMGVLARLVCTRLMPLLVVAVAIFLGWLSSQRIPEATLFTMVYPVLKGYVPPVWSGGFPESPVPPLPAVDDLTLEPRPANERFIQLPGAPTTFLDDTPEEAQAAALKPYQMPQQGIGMCCRYTAYDAESVRRTILWYLQKGGRHIDTADLYLNHEWIGQALQTAMTDYQIPREDIWVTTKVWPRSYGPTSPVEAVQRMLKELQLDYIDLVLMHAPSNSFPFIGPKSECNKLDLNPKECRVETWKALSKVRATGTVRHVGVSNFLTHQLEELQDLAGDGDSIAPIANNQFQYNPWMPDRVHETKDYCHAHGISTTAYSSFSGTAMQHMHAFTVDTLTRIATAHQTTVAQILLSWALQKNFIVIPGTANPKHMAENLKAFDVVLSDQEMADIDALKDDESAKDFFVGPVDES